MCTVGVSLPYVMSQRKNISPKREGLNVMLSFYNLQKRHCFNDPHSPPCFANFSYKVGFGKKEHLYIYIFILNIETLTSSNQ